MTLERAIRDAIETTSDETLLYAQRDTDGDWMVQLVDEEKYHLETTMTRIGRIDRSDIAVVAHTIYACWENEWDTPV